MLGGELRGARERAMRRDRRRWWLCVGPVVLSLADAIATMWGQPPAYWAGNYAAFDECNPVTAWFLAIHPLAIVLDFAGWILLVGLLILYLPQRLALTVALA